jgi:Flp pilus assembly protein TadG
MTGIATFLLSCMRESARDTRGVAAVEFALGTLVLAVGLLNVADIGLYVYTRMEVDYASQMGAQAAWKTCNDQTTMLPATQKCTGLNTVITTSIQSTTLGASVSLPAGSPSENYYCINASNALQVVGSLNSPPSDCSAAGNPGLRPGDYLLVQVNYSYAPLFPGVSVMSASTISRTSWVRLK